MTLQTCEYCKWLFVADRSKHRRFCSKSCAAKKQLTTDPIERFWSHVAKTDYCWEWTGILRKGYGEFWAGDHRRTSAHRYSWEITNGAIPDGLQVLHKCDNPICIRPDHLFLGTDLENIRDKVAKGRQAHGEMVGSHKLTFEAVRKIREEYPAVKNLPQLAMEHGVTTQAVWAAVHFKTWVRN